MAERAFTESEIGFLDHFFTGVQSLDSIYTAKATLSSQIWAFLAGAYSRSTLTMREKLLATVRELAESDVKVSDCAAADVPGAVERQYERLLARPAYAESSLASLLTRAEKFLEKWAVDYGHSSLKDSCTDRFAVESVSIRSTKLIERFTLGAYQEKSTRYVDFSKVQPILSVFGTDPVLESNPQDLAADFHKKSIELYTDILDRAITHYLKLNTNLPADVALRVSKASAFDVARYVLMVNLPTSLGVTVPSRETEKMIKFLRGHHLPEIASIGDCMYVAASETNPALVKHVKPAVRAVTEIGTEFLPLHEFEAGIRSVSSYCDGEVTITTAPETSDTHPRWEAAAALLSFVEDVQVEDLHASAHSIRTHVEEYGPGLVQELWVRAFAGIGQHDDFPETLGNVYIHFDGVLDFGAYRDLQRHRNGYQPDVRLRVDRGYSIPDLLEADGFEDLLARYEDLMSDISHARANANDVQAEYFSCLGHNVLFSYSCSLAQALYIVRLRTGAAGHESYRAFTQSLAKALMLAIPELSRVIQVDWSKKTDRTESELRAQKRRENLESSR